MRTLAPFLGRLVAIAIAWICGQLAARTGVLVDNQTQAVLVEYITNVVTGLLIAYSVSHKWFDKWLNPGDAAGSHIAEQELRESMVLKSKSSH